VDAVTPVYGTLLTIGGLASLVILVCAWRLRNDPDPPVLSARHELSGTPEDDDELATVAEVDPEESLRLWGRQCCDLDKLAARVGRRTR
jgi:hypothetical protein